MALLPNVILGKSSLEENIFQAYTEIIKRFNLNKEDYALNNEGQNQKM